MSKPPPITASRVASELIAQNRAKKARKTTVSPAQRDNINRMNACNPGPAAIATREKAARARERQIHPPKDATTVEAFLAAGGKLERLPPNASGLTGKNGGLRFDHSKTRPPRPMNMPIARIH